MSYFPASLSGFIEKHLIQYSVNLKLKHNQQHFKEIKRGVHCSGIEREELHSCRMYKQDFKYVYT